MTSRHNYLTSGCRNMPTYKLTVQFATVSVSLHPPLVKLNFKCRIKIQNEYSYEIAQNFIFAT